MRDRLYLAYGSNLNMKQMQMRCVTAVPMGTAVIKDYELLFKGSGSGAYLTIEPKKGGRVPVGVWSVLEHDERALDRYEGFPHFYYKKEMEISYRGFDSKKAKKEKAFVYIMHEERPLGRPSWYYVSTCLEGYRSFGFDAEILYAAVERSRLGGERMKKGKRTAVCPLCGNTYHGYPALSRTDNMTLICPDCGTRQALSTMNIGEEEQEEILAIIHRHIENMA